MSSKSFDLDNAISIEFRAALYTQGSRQNRDVCRNFALKLLDATNKLQMPFEEETADSLLSDINHNLTYEQVSLVTAIYLDTANEYQQWCAQRKAPRQEQDRRLIGTAISGAHGGAHYNGNLTVGFNAPHGTETYKSDEEDWQGRYRWVKAVTAGGNGSGHSLGELSGAKQRKEYGAVLPAEEFWDMTDKDRLSTMDKAINPGNFLRALLSYYERPMLFAIGNTTINSGNINNPENRKTASNLDTVYRYMRDIDQENVLTHQRKVRFLVLCSDLLREVSIPMPRRTDDRTKEIYKTRETELRSAKSEIAYQLEQACRFSGVSESDVRHQIDKDKRANYGEKTDTRTKVFASTRTSKSVTLSEPKHTL